MGFTEPLRCYGPEKSQPRAVGQPAAVGTVLPARQAVVICDNSGFLIHDKPGQVPVGLPDFDALSIL